MLRLTDLSVGRGGRVLLEGVSLRLGAGEALMLRGPNGVGKTTLLRAIAGLQPPLAGQIDMAEDCAAYASHKDGVKAQLTVAENLDFWARVYDRAVPEETYETFDLAPLRTRAAGRLSAGQARRLGLARLAVIGRDLLLLDEPTVSLDQVSVRRFADFLRGHLARGGAALIATHIELGLDAPSLDLAPFAAPPERATRGAEAFL